MKKVGLMAGALLFLLAGCGQKGPLYLPQAAQPSSKVPKAAPAPKSKQDSSVKSSEDTTAPSPGAQSSGAQDFNAKDLENEDSKSKRQGN